MVYNVVERRIQGLKTTQKNGKQHISIYVGSELHRELRIAAAWANMSMNEVVRDALRNWIEAHVPEKLREL